MKYLLFWISVVLFLHIGKLKFPPYMSTFKTLSYNPSSANAIDDENLLFYVSFI